MCETKDTTTRWCSRCNHCITSWELHQSGLSHARNGSLIKGRREAVRYPQTVTWDMATNNATSHNGTSWLIPARPGSARRSHHLQPAPPWVGPRHTPCSGWVPSQRLRALAGPGGCRGPGCSVRRYVGCGLPSPVLSHAAVGSLLRLQAGAGPRCPSICISTGGRWPEGPAARWRSCRSGS